MKAGGSARTSQPETPETPGAHVATGQQLRRKNTAEVIASAAASMVTAVVSFVFSAEPQSS